MSNTKASIITIGDELLIGQTIDTNSAWIAKRLNEIGIDVIRRVAVGDNKAAITKAFDEELAVSQIVIVTGGLGPTADDITKPLLLEYFGGSMRVDEGVLEHVTQIFASRKRPMLERNLKQAEVPDTCRVLFNKMGTAPGMWFEREGRVLISLPGVPFEMIGIMQDVAIPLLSKRFTGGAIVHSTIITAGEGESFVAEKIADIEAGLPENIGLAYLPGGGMVKLRLTGKGIDVSELQALIRPYRDALAERLGNIVVTLEDEPMEQIVHKWFEKNGQTLALAESCTSGQIGSLLTNRAGSSGYFRGGVMCYSEDAKVELIGVPRETLATYGAVSEETALAMAAGVRQRLGADHGLAITGLLGPGGDGGKEPVGTVWVGVANKDKVVAKRFKFWGDRVRNKELATNMSMVFLMNVLNGVE